MCADADIFLPADVGSISIPSNYATSAPVLAMSSYSYVYVVTTPTTAWTAPVFTAAATASALPSCSRSQGLCPGLHGGTCVDSMGNVYGVLCDTRFSGIIIDSTGRKRGKEKRFYTDDLDACLTLCDQFDKNNCAGAAFQNGQCQMYDTITGTFVAVGDVAAIRQ